MGQSSRLAAAQLDTLAELARLAQASAFYLAGGGAVALHFGHRQSRDLDLFTRGPAVDLEVLRRTLVTKGGVEVLAISDTTLAVRMGGVPVDFVNYPYSLLEEPLTGPAGIRYAGIKDLAVMKLVAIARRGFKRDFWDLHELLVRGPMKLGRALSCYRQRFGVAEADTYHVLKALTYFADAESEDAPLQGMKPAHWRAIKAFFEKQVREIMRFE
ncbi:MAG: nucleotidyl transferase AbiEii/AbiGii toxin family protein [Proteobacteria bacterium]|nr:nucleotidyl transferase AbiEii/AbiGii toxin family protein [Pseudomonadota bacterium]